MTYRQQKPEYVPTNEDVPFQPTTSGFRLTIEWHTQSRQHADLDIFCLIYDDVARCYEKVTADSPLSSDGALQLQTDISKADVSKSLSNDENVHIDLRRLSTRTTAVAVFIDGGARNFNACDKLYLHCTQENTKDMGNLSFMQQLQSDADRSKVHLFSSEHYCRPQDYEGMVGCVVYKNGFNSTTGTVQWVCKAIFEPTYKVKMQEKVEFCTTLLLSACPLFDKFRPRIFSSVKSICSALSSTALPRLKKSFVASSKGLPMDAFTEELFVQLFDTKPRLLEPTEAAYTVALLQDLFGQIDFNGDGFVDWDEFTTFCIHTGLVNDEGNAASVSSSLENLNQYTIEYSENHGDILDTTLTSYLTLYQVRHVPETRRLLVLEESGAEIVVFNDQFEHLCSIDPGKLSAKNKYERTNEQLRVYDICYIPFKDMYAFTASDHTITIFKEHSSVGGKRLHHATFNRLYHQHLQLKLCWSERSQLLCSIDSENIVYGWELDGSIPLFQLSRHTELITDFIAIDAHQLFVTCSLDKRIVLWSQTSRRVKGVLLGHTRGVRCVSYAKDTLLSAGFECEAKTWDMATKEPALLLRGHRFPICCAKIMCRSQSQDDADNLRAVTVDDSGEIRLWNIFVKEKSSDLGMAELLQVFVGQDESKTAQISFIFFPFTPRFTTDKYSNIIAASSKLLHYQPEKIKKEFISPSCIVFSDCNAAILTAVGKSIVKYDVINGGYQCEFDELDNGEISSFCSDGEHGRRLYVGMVNGGILVVNLSTGQTISKVMVHLREVTNVTVVANKDDPSNGTVFSASSDGCIKALTESGGILTIHFALENALGDIGSDNGSAPITVLKTFPSQSLISAASRNRSWGIWTYAFKRVVNQKEEENISGLEEVEFDGKLSFRNGDVGEYTANMVVIAVCLANCVKIYCVNFITNKLAHSHTLLAPELLYLSKLISLSYPKFNSVNYAATNNPAHLNLENVLIASSDEGKVVVWNLVGVGIEAVEAFYTHHSEALQAVEMVMPLRSTEESTTFKKKKVEQKKKVRQTRYLISQASLRRQEEIGSSVIGDDASVDEGSMQASRVASLFSKPSQQLLSETDVGSRDKKPVKTLQAALWWYAHTDGILSLIPAVEHNCFVSMSLDGYIRLWNLQEECVGEVPLPNIADHHRRQPRGEKLVARPASWKFVMEKMPVTWQHRSIAAGLVKMVRKDQSNQRRHSATQEYYHRRFQNQLQKSQQQLLAVEREMGNEDDDEATVRRKVVMAELFAPYVPTEDGGLDSILAATTNKNKSKNTSKTQGNDGDASDDSSSDGGELLFKEYDASNPFAAFDEADSKASRSPPSSPGKGDKSSSLSSLARPLSQSTTGGGEGQGGAISHTKSKQQRGDKTSSVSASGRPRTTPASSSTALHSHSRSLFRATEPWNDLSDLQANRIAAFSDASINTSHTQGVIDKEAHTILRRLNGDKNRVLVYDRTQPTVHLRNVNKACTMTYPGGETDCAEVSFGYQKDMYKHAATIIRDQSKSRPSSVNIARQTVAKARISNLVSHAGKMLHFTEHAAFGDVVLPPLLAGKLAGEESQSTEPTPKVEVLARNRGLGLRRSASTGLQQYDPNAKKMLDKERIANMMQKVTDASNESTPEWEKRLDHKNKQLKRSRTQKKIDRYNNAHEMLLVLERKLKTAIMSAHQGVDSDVMEVRKNLTTRDLLPFYKILDLKNFLEIYHKVDVDLSGDLNVDEWLEFFSAFNKSVTIKQARTMFVKMDDDNDGFLSLRDLVPVIFSRANKEQLVLIMKYMEADVCNKKEITAKEYVLKEDLEAMFAHYDAVDHLGFVGVQQIKDKIRSFQMSDQAHLAIFAIFMGYEDDEMVNMTEFIKLFAPYTSRKPMNVVGGQE